MVGLLLAGALLFAGLFLPGGLSPQEMDSVVVSQSLSAGSPATRAVADLPYHAVQAALIALFGVTILTIKLPSLILALLSALGLIMLLRRWFKPNIAVMASLIAISTSQFIYIAQLGAPSIMYIFWPIALLLLGTQVTRVQKWRFLWKILFALTAALSLYTPLSIYPLLAIALAIALHPHLRAIVRKLSHTRLAVIGVIFLLVSAPLIYLIVLRPQLAVELLGIPPIWPPALSDNIATLINQYFIFWQPNSGSVMTPVYGLGTALIICMGLYRLVRTRETTRSYLIIIWLVCLLPVLLFNPALTAVTLVPSVLILAAGLTSLIGYWYRLFPRNPYARVAGLIPVAILMSALLVSGLTRYAYGYHYNPAMVEQFSQDLSLLPADAKHLIVAQTEVDFWQAIAHRKDGLRVATHPPSSISDVQTFVMTREARGEVEGYQIVRIITGPRSADADRFYVYQKVPQ